MENLIRNIESQTENTQKCKVYKRRWLILFLFISLLFSNLVQIQQYVSIKEIVVKYYYYSETDVNWSTFVHMLFFVIFVVPSTYIIEKLGLRKIALLGAFGTAIGAWVKVAAVAPDRFWVVILGQSINSVFQALILPVPLKIAAVWFGPKEISTACSIGILSTPVSIALSFIIQPLIIDTTNLDTIGNGLYITSIIYAVLPTLLLVILFIYFPERPPLPPTLTQVQIQRKFIPSHSNFFKSLKILITNPSFVYLNISYGLNIGIFYAIMTLLNPIIMKYHPGTTTAVSITGFLMNLVGALGSLVVGIILDNFRNYELTLWVIVISYIASLAGFLFLIDQGIYFVYIFATLFGALFPTCLEIGIELNYPEPEVFVGGIMLIGTQLSGIMFTYLCTYLLENTSALVTNSVICGILMIGNIFLIFIEFDLKREVVLKASIS